MSPEGPDGGGPRVMVNDTDTRDTVTLKGAGTVIANLADGAAATDAVIVRQLDQQTRRPSTANNYADAADVTALNKARTYTDQKFAAYDQGLDQFRDEVNDRFHKADRRIDSVGALSSAMAGMTGAIAGANPTPSRVSIGAGNYHGRNAMSLGYSRQIGSHGNAIIGSAFTNGDSAIGAGASFG